MINDSFFRWRFNIYIELMKQCENMTDNDTYTLLTLMERTMWRFVRETYNKDYRLPYIMDE